MGAKTVTEEGEITPAKELERLVKEVCFYLYNLIYKWPIACYKKKDGKSTWKNDKLFIKSLMINVFFLNIYLLMLKKKIKLN